jgi:Plant transposon protein
VERAFDVLQTRFAIINNPVRIWCKETIGQIMRACVIMHNMIVENERDSYFTNFDYSDEEVNINVSRPQIRRSRLVKYEDYIRNHSRIHERSINHRLQADLVEEIWNRFGADVFDD